MPSFIFWASLAILGIFLFSSFRLMFQCSSSARALATLATELKAFSKKEAQRESQRESMTHKNITSLRALMMKFKLTAAAWERFEDTLVAFGSAGEPRGTFFCTQPIESAFSRESLIEDHVNTKLFQALPGVLTGVGLLMTFVAILDGLSHVTVTANMDVKGIGGLINGLSGKFFSSIVAVTCAVCFIFVERMAYSKPERAHRELTRELNKLFKRKTAEGLLVGIHNELATQATAQKKLLDSMMQLHGK